MTQIKLIYFTIPFNPPNLKLDFKIPSHSLKLFGLFLGYGWISVLGVPDFEISELEPFDSKSQMNTLRREICSLNMGSQVTQRKHLAKINQKYNQNHK